MTSPNLAKAERDVQMLNQNSLYFYLTNQLAKMMYDNTMLAPFDT